MRPRAFVGQPRRSACLHRSWTAVKTLDQTGTEFALAAHSPDPCHVAALRVRLSSRFGRCADARLIGASPRRRAHSVILWTTEGSHMRGGVCTVFHSGVRLCWRAGAGCALVMSVCPTDRALSPHAMQSSISLACAAEMVSVGVCVCERACAPCRTKCSKCRTPSAPACRQQCRVRASRCCVCLLPQRSAVSE